MGRYTCVRSGTKDRRNRRTVRDQSRLLASLSRTLKKDFSLLAWSKRVRGTGESIGGRSAKHSGQAIGLRMYGDKKADEVCRSGRKWRTLSTRAWQKMQGVVPARDRMLEALFQPHRIAE